MNVCEISRPVAQMDTLSRVSSSIGGIASIAIATPTRGKPGERPTCSWSGPQMITLAMTVSTSVQDSGTEPIRR
ncbi:hypothetical protein Leucomu_06540 [Leucobacter muris]|jgi:hypothetical protein|uniref:Uncharacterized protein n=1 Tax=Leucobacter muris TaxID=1935379 RepID=A0ABX5QEW9_9MICO|nr:hypothetical protein Leucomu_06540 [Leucobacter muris]